MAITIMAESALVISWKCGTTWKLECHFPNLIQLLCFLCFLGTSWILTVICNGYSSSNTNERMNDVLLTPHTLSSCKGPDRSFWTVWLFTKVLEVASKWHHAGSYLSIKAYCAPVHTVDIKCVACTWEYHEFYLIKAALLHYNGNA